MLQDGYSENLEMEDEFEALGQRLNLNSLERSHGLPACAEGRCHWEVEGHRSET